MEIKLQKKLTKYLIPASSLLILAIAIAMVTLNLASIPESRLLLVATRDLAEGESLEPEDVEKVRVPLGSISSGYLQNLTQKLVLSNSVAKGQLIPKRDLVSKSGGLIPVRLNGLQPIPSAINVGDRVDIWAIGRNQSLESTPEPVAFNAIITLIESSNSMTQSSMNVEVRIGEEYLETLLGANDSNFQLFLILHESLADSE